MQKTRLILVLVGWMAAMPALAGTDVAFDVSPLVACRDVTTSDHLTRHPHERLYEARIDASLLITGGSRTQVAECQFQFQAPERRIIVSDYLPKTTLGTDIVGNIDVQRSHDDSKNLQVSIGGRYQSVISGDVNAGGHRNQSEAYRYEKLPPRETLAAAGTVARGSGAYFKLRSSSQTSVEGSHQFIVVFRTDNNWRGDYLRAVCVAKTPDGRVCGQASFLVPIFREGDLEARKRASELYGYEQQLIRTANRYQKAVRRISLPTFVHELSILPPELPANWLARTINTPANQSQHFEGNLPLPVQSAIDTYRDAKLALSNMSADVLATQPRKVEARLVGISEADDAIQEQLPAKWTPRG